MIPLATIHVWADDDGSLRAHFDAVHTHGVVPEPLTADGFSTLEGLFAALTQRLAGVRAADRSVPHLALRTAIAGSPGGEERP